MDTADSGYLEEGIHVVRTLTFSTALWSGLACFGLSFAGAWIEAQANAVPERVTYSRDVAPILFENCATCHRPGEIAPMSLHSYDEVRPWAKSIREKVTKREMPPWFADPAHGKFANDASLSEDEIAIIAKWVDQGARRGDVKDMPPFPEFTDGWKMGEPDFIIELPEVTVPASGPDYFPDLSFTADVPKDEWVRAVEIRPSNREVAHHVVIFMAGMGRGGGGMGGNFSVLGVWAVGTEPNVYPEGMGRRITPGQRFMTNMHYHPNGTEATDQTRVGLYFGEGELQQEIDTVLSGSFTFSIPAGAANHREVSTWYVENDIKVVSLFPHMHLRGKDMKFTALYPDGRSEVLLSVPKYDFDWQLYYYPEELISLPAGTKVELEAHWDNSAGNPDNPDPTRTVGFGTNTTDEMMFGLVEYYYEDGPEREQLSDEERMAQIAATLPEGEAYSVDFKFGSMGVPSVLHLPREGDGEWLVSFQGQQLGIPVREVVWVGDRFEFVLTLRFGSMGGDFTVVGTVSDDGVIAGTLSSEDKNTMMIMTDFEGTRAGS